MKKKRVLIVDDETGFTRLLQLNLHWTGRYAVRTENPATAALDAAREFQPDVILLDVMMPGMDGGGVATRLQQHPATRQIPIIFVTAAVSKDEVASRRGHIGGACYIAKPVDLEELMQCVEDQCGGNRCGVAMAAAGG
jgi:CheY-like chemotaxis protein